MNQNMKPKMRLMIAALLAIAFSACTTTPRKYVDFNRDRKIDNSESSVWVGTQAKQNGQFVRQDQLFGYLKIADYSHPQMIAAEKNSKISMPLSAIAIGIVAASGFSNNLEDQGKILGYGLITWLAALYFESSSQKLVNQAIEQHNQHIEVGSF